MSKAAELAATSADIKDGLNIGVLEVRAMFGKHPEDVISPIKSAGDAFCWLEEILVTIQREADSERSSIIRIKRLAECASYIAVDFSNYLDCEHGDMIEQLRMFGVVAKPEVKS